jgi:hypothetical protein
MERKRANSIVGEPRLSSKERMLRALTGEEPDVFPAVPGYLILFLADFERSYYIEQYRLRMRGRQRYSINHAEDTRFRARAVYQSYGIFKVRPDWIEIRQGPSRDWAERTDIVRKDDILYYEDRESGARIPMRDAPLPRGDREHTAKDTSVEDVWDASRQLQSRHQVDDSLPILSAPEMLARGQFELPRQVMADYGDQYFISTILSTPYPSTYNLLGFQGLMLIQHDHPELFHYLLERVLEREQQVMEAWAAVGIHGVYAQEIFTGADIISPRSYDEFVFAYNQPYFQHMSALGLLPIHYPCGDVIPRLERIVQFDIAAVALEESKKGFVLDIEEVVRRVDGQVSLFGNIDAVRFGAGAGLDEMAAEVKRQARVGARAKGFVLSTGSPFPLDTNPRLIDTMVNTAHALSHPRRNTWQT